jgi:2-polyprenyl-3-methyl-5-hydroxy-6-metoxy-1,4-benzoquinol methylase
MFALPKRLAAIRNRFSRQSETLTQGRNDPPMSTDKDWEHFAEMGPYWAVLTEERFKGKTISDATRAEFYATGEGHIQYVLHWLTRYFDAPERFGTALDFGCGVGRLLFPLARRSDLAIGVDISPTMLRECRQNADAAGLKNIDLVTSDPTLSGVVPTLDLVTSFIVLQHIPTDPGYQIINALCDKLNPGGLGYLQLTFAREIRLLTEEQGSTTGRAFRYYQRIGDTLVRIVSKTSNTQMMQMNHYNLNEVMCILADNHIRSTFVNQTNHDGDLGVELFFKKST